MAHKFFNKRLKQNNRVMKTTKSTPQSASEKSTKASKLQELFEEELKDIYWAEKALTKAIPKMIKKASSKELAQALESHLKETEKQVTRIEEIFSDLGKKPQSKKCEAVDGLIKEAEEIMSDSEDGSMRDAGIISAAQKVEHYEIASYGTLRTFAQTLGLTHSVELLEETLSEEKNADVKLTEIAVASINEEAASESVNQ